ncbi:MAG: hypothetical protein HQM10_19520 [Candidatus Riflebacteria bacterium]|nr:hypothetical protein [Candidatus Riflebacteria bacterium]
MLIRFDRKKLFACLFVMFFISGMISSVFAAESAEEKQIKAEMAQNAQEIKRLSELIKKLKAEGADHAEIDEATETRRELVWRQNELRKRLEELQKR